MSLLQIQNTSKNNRKILNYFLRVIVFSFLSNLVVSSTSVAHPMDVVYFEANQFQSPSFNACLNIHPVPLKKALNSDSVTDIILKNNLLFSAKSAKDSCLTQYIEHTSTEIDVRICYEVICPVDILNLTLDFNFLESLDTNFSIIGKLKINDLETSDSEKIFKADIKNKIYTFSGAESQTENFFLLGIEHIGASYESWLDENKKIQIPDGIDHILFIVVLLLICTNLRALIVSITGFTIGHSISLALALSHIFVISAKFIEPLIALSIAYLALKGVLKKRKDSIWLTVLFGCLHGMGFSYALEKLKINSVTEFIKTLIVFNLGIEAGQIIILSFLTPLAVYIYKEKKYSAQIKFWLCLVILFLALFWTFKRTLLLL